MDGAGGLHLDVVVSEAEYETLRQVRADRDQQHETQQPRKRLEVRAEPEEGGVHRKLRHL